MTTPERFSLTVEGARCRLGTLLVLNNLDLPPLDSGQVVALIGPNGSGKSTLLKSIAGLVPARFKSLSVAGHSLQAESQRKRASMLRYLPQSLPESVRLTVTEAMLVALNVRKRTVLEEAMQKSLDVLGGLGIASLAPMYIDELSGGQKQLVGIAQTLVDEPMILLLDEPLASLDLNYQHHVMRMLNRLALERNMLVIIVLHDLNMALRYAHSALLLYQGRLLAGGDPHSVISPMHLSAAFKVHTRIRHEDGGHGSVYVQDPIEL